MDAKANRGGRILAGARPVQPRPRWHDLNMHDSVPAPNIGLPTDLDGFAIRECPLCSRQFKLRMRDSATRRITRSVSRNADARSGAMTGHCPLCHGLVVHGNWCTDAQREYVRRQRIKAAWVAYSDQFLVAAKGSRALIELAGFPPVFVSDATLEADDMRLVVLPCHENWPLKVPTGWSADISCFRCGARFPMGPGDPAR